MRRSLGGLLFGLAVALAGPVTASVAEEADVAPVIEKLKEKDGRMEDAFEDAHAYAVFPKVAKGGMGLGGARGNGYVYAKGELVGLSTLTQITIGLQLGGQVYSEVIFFEDAATLDNFKRGRIVFDARVSAVALKAGAAGDLPYRKGVAVVTMARGGLMYEAVLGGQQFSFRPVRKR